MPPNSLLSLSPILLTSGSVPSLFGIHSHSMVWQPVKNINNKIRTKQTKIELTCFWQLLGQLILILQNILLRDPRS